MRMKIVVVAGLLILLSGCADKEPVAAPSADERESQAMKYSQCMRDNGVPSFPDPVDGRLQIQIRKGSDLDPDSEAFQKAQETCKPYAPAGLGEQQANGAQQAQMLKFVACMRENGVPNMPDPQPDGRMLIGGPDGGGVDPESPAFQDAQAKCRDQMPAGMR
ncbi:hypothetical protein [Paractinoplanes rishiriensis]|uniref:Lipoprotein n=1 Tax=Paractinoplanes rishiriensis TaxID=1050105 RepID=A0A919K0K3_9ACTN|nr:hypothetical protein [Actinoplanes rishiriensis]GIE96619.1 hypothetical protein Ari01nite_40840 [Actinoplanes rishiriensis]